MGEGAGILVLESLEHAQKRGAPIIAEYLGGAVTCDAHHMTDPRADGLGVSTCIEKVGETILDHGSSMLLVLQEHWIILPSLFSHFQALIDGGVNVEEVNYINGHATSTVVGDLAEVRAIKKVFQDTSNIKMNATKSMIGHSLGAAGGLEAVSIIKAIEVGRI